jgi:hypothetical protein
MGGTSAPDELGADLRMPGTIEVEAAGRTTLKASAKANTDI